MASFGEEVEKELLSFLDRSARTDLKAIAIEQLLGMTGTDDGKTLIGRSPRLLNAVLLLVADTNETVARNAILCVVNLSSDDFSVATLMELKECRDTMLYLLQSAVDPGYKLADPACSVLSNVTRLQSCAHALATDVLEKVGLDKIVEALCKTRFNKDADLHYLATFLMNMTQVSAVRLGLLERPRSLIKQLLPLTALATSSIHRRGIVGVVKNCCFEYDAHAWLLSEEVDILPHLLLPLAGPEDLDEDDMEKLPPDVQYLPATHARESDPEIRKMLLEAFTKLCSTRTGRLYLKDKNVYVIVRELHKWEKEEGNIPSILNLVDLLIGDEPQRGMEDLHTVEVPPHLQEKFQDEEKSAS